eukprot:TRINITY_DN18069_c0_g1_i1.p1 TRINITY_DN18069_c0_g1~~TRINITY_DN18069_c0_g1_i1.p1  ORF type:complete len:311 (+),score=83.57 TRINITY_DN18069_c0_g1_i1:39-935(+)
MPDFESKHFFQSSVRLHQLSLHIGAVPRKNVDDFETESEKDHIPNLFRSFALLPDQQSRLKALETLLDYCGDTTKSSIATHLENGEAAHHYTLATALPNNNNSAAGNISPAGKEAENSLESFPKEESPSVPNMNTPPPIPPKPIRRDAGPLLRPLSSPPSVLAAQGAIPNHQSQQGSNSMGTSPNNSHTLIASYRYSQPALMVPSISSPLSSNPSSLHFAALAQTPSFYANSSSLPNPPPSPGSASSGQLNPYASSLSLNLNLQNNSASASGNPRVAQAFPKRFTPKSAILPGPPKGV